MNKRISVLFIFVLLFQTISTGLMLPGQTMAQGSEQKSIINENITVMDEEGNVLEPETLTESTSVNIHIDWSVEDMDVAEGSKDSIKLPSNYSISGTQSGALGEAEAEVGTYEATENGTVTVLFNESVVENPKAKGTIEVAAVLEVEAVKEDAAEEESTANSGEDSNAAEEETTESDAPEEGKEASSDKTAEKSDTPEEDEEASSDKTAEKETMHADATESKEDKLAKAGEDKEKTVGTFAELKENIFTFKSLTHDDQKIVDGSIIDINDGEQVQLKLDWDTKDLDVKSGDTASMQLPDVFDQVTISEQDLITSGTKVGTYGIQDGKLIFEFNDQIEEGDVHNGKVGLNLDFNLQKFEEDIEQVIDFNDSEETTLNVVAKPSKTASGITKEGHSDQKHNASEITWTVDVINNSEKTVTDATLNDTLPEGLDSPENFVVKSLSTNLDGDKELGDVVNTYSGNITDGIEFDELKPFKGYRVEYTTPITDKDKTKFTNEASFYNGTKDLTAKATVGGLTTSNPIEKSGVYDDDTGQIDWSIVANENGTDIDNAIIEDELPDGLTLDEESLTVNKYVGGSFDEEVATDQTAFPIKLGKTAANEHYEVTFSTDVGYEKVNNGEYQKQNKFKNTTTLKDGEDELGGDDAIVDFTRAPLLEKTGTSNVDYNDKTLSWTIDVNRAKHPLNDLEITDLIPTGLSIAEGDIVITDEEGEDFQENSITINPTDDVKQKVVIDLGDIGTQHLTIEYTTGIEDFNVDAFKNTVSISGDGIGEGDHDTGKEITPPGNSFEKSFESIDYNEKTMDWSLKVDPKREAITSLTIEDIFPNKGMILKPDSVTVKHSESGDELKEGEGKDYTLEPRTNDDGEEGYHKGFIIELNDKLDGGYLTVDYQTSYDPEVEVEGDTLDPHVSTEGKEQVYENNANYSGMTENDNDFDVDRDAHTEVREDSWNSGKKEGKLVHEDGDGNVENGWQSGSERKIEWQLYTNYQKQNLGSDVTIIDTLEYEGTIDEDSIKVSTYDVNADGETTINEDGVLDKSKYSVDVSGDQFTLTFNETVTERYVVEFLTTVPKISQQGYTNGATVKVGEDEYPYEGTVDYAKADDFLDKSAKGQDGSNVYIGDKVNWEVDVNDSLSIIENADITDKISAGLEYVKGSLEVSTKDGKSLNEVTDYTLSKKTTEAGETVLTIELEDTLDQALTLKYTTVVTAKDGDTVNNEISLNGKNIEKETITSEELTAEQFSWVEGEFNENRGALKIVKADSETEDAIANNPATFELYYELNGERVQFGNQFQTNEKGKLQIGNLPLRTYYVKEVEAPTGYIIDENEQKIDITDPYGTDENVYEMEFTNTIEKTDISVTKEWDDAKNQDGTRPDTVDVQLLADGDPIEDIEKLSEKNDWAYTWEDLDAYQSNGKEIKYTVQEVDVPKGYESTTKKDDEGNITITNTHAPETIEVSVSKKWEDANDQDGVRPNNVKVNLLDGSEVVTEAVLNEDNNWQHTFTDLPKYDNGKKIDYSVTEDTVVNYSTSVKTTATDEGLNSVVTNTHTPGETSVTVTKGWDDGNNQDGNRPDSIQVQLNIVDGEELKPVGEPVKVTSAEGWTHTWDGLDANANGEPIEYTVEELNVPEEYEVSINDDNHGNIMITNSYEPELTEIAVRKTWKDDDNQDGVRPNNVTINLLGNGEIVRQTVLDEINDWQHIFKELPVYKDGVEIDYRVTENTVPEYSTSVEADEENENGFVVTNSYTPDKTSVTVTKGWDDENNQDGKRPENIEVQLTAGSEPVENQEPIVLDESNNWTHTWDDLDANADGEEIDYSVEELNVPEGYEVSVNDRDHGNIIITNSYAPELINIPVKKVWDDGKDQDDLRPNSVTVNLLGNSEIISSAVLSEKNGWQHTFSKLAKYENNGEEINYTITEDAVPEYSTSIETDKENENGYVVTNMHIPGTTSVSGEKTWKDGNNQDGNRPESITVNLMADGEQEDSVDVSKASDWQYNFKNLPTHNNGEKITYTVEEEPVEGYETEINGYDITNTVSEFETKNVSVTKEWEDGNNQDGNRPEAITVQLLADGEETGEPVKLRASNEWNHTWDDLAVNNNGQTIAYTVEEIGVPEEYEAQINYDDPENIIITNSYTPEVTEVAVSKVWEDEMDHDGLRPESVTVNLLNDMGAVIDETELTAEDDWKDTFTDLPKYKNGEEINYSVTENTVPKYSTSIVKTETENGTNNVITNSYTPGETSVTVTKGWDDGNNQDGVRPKSIEVQLMANGEPKGATVELTAKDNWTYTWKELDEISEGEPINYTVKEPVVPEGYEVSVNDRDHGNIILTNTHEPEETEVAVTKVWDDENNQDGVRPNNVTVNLLADGEIVKQAVLNEKRDWQHTFTDLPVYENGTEINYSVTENTVPEYSTSVEADEENENGFVVTNLYTPDKTSVTVTKGWDDGNNQDGNRPESIKVQLLANGEETGDLVELNVKDGWTHTWDGLDLNANGEEVNYSVKELNVPEGYEVSVNDSDHGNIILTNSYTPEVIDITGMKTWKDADNQDGIRPESITVNLLANGEQAQSVEVTEEDNWEYSFTDVPKYEAGEVINYSITENAVDGYEAEIDGYDITNTLTPADSGTDDSNEEESSDTPGTDEEDSSKPDTPSTENAEETSGTPGNGKENQLPDTATNMYNLLVLGTIMLIIGATLLLLYRRRVR